MERAGEVANGDVMRGKADQRLEEEPGVRGGFVERGEDRRLDPRVLGAVVLCLFGVALIAASVPAWRASRVNPLVALRYE